MTEVTIPQGGKFSVEFNCNETETIRSESVILKTARSQTFTMITNIKLLVSETSMIRTNVQKT